MGLNGRFARLKKTRSARNFIYTFYNSPNCGHYILESFTLKCFVRLEIFNFKILNLKTLAPRCSYIL